MRLSGEAATSCKVVRLAGKMQQLGSKAGFVPGVEKGQLVVHGAWEVEETDDCSVSKRKEQVRRAVGT